MQKRETESSGIGVSPEIPPYSLDHDSVFLSPIIRFLCDRCREQAENPKRFQAGEDWRCLSQTVWSEVPAVQVMAVRLLRRQADSQPWAQETLEQVFLDPEVEAWADAAV